jgi:hypothetical protein
VCEWSNCWDTTEKPGKKPPEENSVLPRPRPCPTQVINSGTAGNRTRDPARPPWLFYAVRNRNIPRTEFCLHVLKIRLRWTQRYRLWIIISHWFIDGNFCNDLVSFRLVSLATSLRRWKMFFCSSDFTWVTKSLQATVARLGVEKEPPLEDSPIGFLWMNALIQIDVLWGN